MTRVIRFAVVLGLVLAVLGAAAPALAAGPRPSISLPNPLGGLSNLCNNTSPPTPASPYGDGNWIVRTVSPASALGVGGDAVSGNNGSTNKGGGTNTQPVRQKAVDPFLHPGSVSLASTYGTTPQWANYDNGCGGQFLDGAGTSIADILLEAAGTLPNWSQALLDSVIGPDSWLSSLDKPVVDATRAATAGLWAPWLGVALLLVGLLVLWRARSGRLSGSVSALVWAFGILIAVSWLTSYPAQSVRAVDSGVSTATSLIATGFDHHSGSSAAAQGQGAVDQQMDQVVRTTQYRTWLAGEFGSADSATAHKYGPKLFRDTHFTWAEWDAYQSDPTGAGAKILSLKQNGFKNVMDTLKSKDPLAYSYATGDHWWQRIELAVVNLLTTVFVCGFLLVAGLAILLSFVLIRLVVPFAPAAGPIAMFDAVQDAALALFRKIVGPLVMGPVYFVVALILLRFDASILSSGLWFMAKLFLVILLAFVAWKLTRPAAYGPRIPLTGLRRIMGRLQSSGEAEEAPASPTPVPARAAVTTEENGQSPALVGRATAATAAPVGVVPRASIAGSARTGSLESAYDDARALPAPSPVNSGSVPYRPHRDDDLLPTRQDPPSGWRPATESGATPTATFRPRDGDASRLHPANVEYDDDGKAVFTIYTPAGARTYPVDEVGPVPATAAV